MLSKRTVLMFILILLALASCATPPAAGPTTSTANQPPSAPAADSAAGGRSSSGGPGLAESKPAPADVARLVIKNADLTIVVDNPGAGMATITKMASDMSGFVVSSKSFKTKISSGVEVPQASITVRVPAEKLDEALAKVKALVRDPSRDIISDTTTGKDVTADYVDLQSRLTNLQNTEEQLLKIQDSATKTDEVLAVFNQLTQIRQQIEQIKGQIKFYEESANLSAISVQLLSAESIAPITIGGWAPVGVVRDAFQALINVGKLLVEVLIWLVVLFLPLGLVLYFPGRWIWRWVKRWLARRTAVAAHHQSIRPPAPLPPIEPSSGIK